MSEEEKPLSETMRERWGTDEKLKEFRERWREIIEKAKQMRERIGIEEKKEKQKSDE